MKRKPILLISMLALLLFLGTMMGCSSKSASDPALSSASKEAVFALYNKVQFNQTKAQIDDMLGSAGKVSASYDKCYSYMDKNHEYGVDVVYDDKQKATSKTVIYPTHKDIAPFTSKAVSKAQADKLQKGMTYDEAKSILGGDGVEVSVTEIPYDNNKLSYIYRWANKDGSCIQVVIVTDGTIGNVLYYEE